MSAGADAKKEVRRAARTAQDSGALEYPARVGFGASGLVQVLVGALAIQLGIDHVGEADQTGALAAVAKIPGGVVVIWISVLGLLSLALWLLTEAVLVRGGAPAHAWKRRLEFLGKAVAYIALGLTALAFALGHPSHATSTARSFSAGLLALPAGQLLLGLAGLVAVAVGGSFVWKGIRHTFTKDLVMPKGLARRGVLVLGTVGYIAKGIVVGVAGVVFIVSAVRQESGSATGLAGALDSLERLPFGLAVLFAVAAGLIASGVYNIARAWLARF